MIYRVTYDVLVSDATPAGAARAAQRHLAETHAAGIYNVHPHDVECGRDSSFRTNVELPALELETD